MLGLVLAVRIVVGTLHIVKGHVADRSPSRQRPQSQDDLSATTTAGVPSGQIVRRLAWVPVRRLIDAGRKETPPLDGCS
jgi:hypothetical protein